MLNSGRTPAARTYEIDGAAADAASFIAAACDPAVSVVVEACAGSGKTWLLVARMLRLLLDGCEPSAMLAITFTRKAAQEMHERLMLLLRELALLPDSAVAVLLTERGVVPEYVHDLLPTARGLYERVLSSSQALSVDTFHSWFARLLQAAPLASGVPHGYALSEATAEMLAETHNRFMQSINGVAHAPVRKALHELYMLVGDYQAGKLLDAFVARRAEWWAMRQAGDPLESLRALCSLDGEQDTRLALWSDAALCARIIRVARLLGLGTAVNQKRGKAIAVAMNTAGGLDAFHAVCNGFLDAFGEPRRNLATKALRAALRAEFGADQASAQSLFDNECVAIGRELSTLVMKSQEPSVLALNAALMTVGDALLEEYQALKAERRVFDFADLEWHAYRLLSNTQHAAYLQSRLDARYRHVLLDEFQDTNPLQWSVVRGWLEAYGDDAARPSVFVVGDPKQSIYRFRRAEPKVFIAARALLESQGGRVLRTSQTRRNAAAITTALNSVFASNPLYAPQTTLAAEAGAVWCLPFASMHLIGGDGQLVTESSQPVMADLRDPLHTAREEEDDVRRFREGTAVAHAIAAARAACDRTAPTPGRWSDVLLLVKRRAHLASYERALREAGIPFVSDKRGGLLESLEVSDMIALLTFLITPGDNRALAHILKSPVFRAGDEDLMLLASRTEATWWQRLQGAFAPDVRTLAIDSAVLRRAVVLLSNWRSIAPRLPVHDLLDIILDQGQIAARYAQSAPPLQRQQVIGNLHAFIELSLTLDAGRYPSLPKFIDALRTLQRNAARDAPDEAAVDAGLDAVRILTIHSAKGLEAPIVVLLDANHSEIAREDAGVLCAWPQQAIAPIHFSGFVRKTERGLARDEFFRDEDAMRLQEDWNLLYVAATRARQILIVSGVAGTRNAGADGVIAGSWYSRMRSMAQLPEAAVLQPAAVSAPSPGTPTIFSLSLYRPRQLPYASSALPSVPQAAATLPEDVDEVMAEGIWLRLLLERITANSSWPVAVPDAGTSAAWLGCTVREAEQACIQARSILASPALQRFFNPRYFRSAQNALELLAGGALMRADRVVYFASETWVLDYKRSVDKQTIVQYAGQLAGYRQMLQATYPGVPVHAALINAEGCLWQLA